MHERCVPARPPPRRSRFGAPLEENSHQLRVILVNRLVQSGLCDPRMPVDHLERGLDLAAMADPHHLVLDLALWRGRCHRWTYLSPAAEIASGGRTGRSERGCCKPRWPNAESCIQ